MSYKDFWAYKAVKENGYKIRKVTGKPSRRSEDFGELGVDTWMETETHLRILFDDGDEYVHFHIYEMTDSRSNGEPDKYGNRCIVYLIDGDDDSSEDITDELEFTDTLDEAIQSCIYFFYVRV